MTKMERQVRQLLDENGWQIVRVRRGRHLVLRVRKGKKVRRISAPLTPSDQRWERNFVAEIRRLDA